MRIRRADPKEMLLTMETKYNLISTIPAKCNNGEWLPLSYHLIDTEKTILHLLSSYLPTDFFREINLSKEECIRFCTFLALTHDLGKVTPAFLDKITASSDVLKQKTERYGFIAQKGDLKHARASEILLFNFLCEEQNISTDDDDARILSAAIIVGAHHGKLAENYTFWEELETHKTEYGWNSDIWKSAQYEVITEALQKSGYDSLQALPEVSETAQMALSGLLIMADWIASNQNIFPLLSIMDTPSEYPENRAELAFSNLELSAPYAPGENWKNHDFFLNRFGFEQPNEIQTEIMNVASNMQTPGIIILESTMGSGKTEAALAAAEIMISRFNLGGIAFFLPSQTTTNAMFERLANWMMTQSDVSPVSTQLLHSNANMNNTFKKIKNQSFYTDNEDPDLGQLTVTDFFNRKKTGLLANLVVGTIDQLLMAALNQKHLMLRHLGITGKVVVIDECHAYDAYMNVYLDRILQWLGAYNIPVILLSATLPGKRRSELITSYSKCKNKNVLAELKENRDYPLLSWSNGESVYYKKLKCEKTMKSVSIKKIKDEDIISSIKKAMDCDGSVGIILNTVVRAQQFIRMIQEEFPNGRILIDHSRFLLEDRLANEESIIKHVGKLSDLNDRKGTIIIGTQVLEQSLDLDFDLLITDLCPMDLLLQRIGRLHRHDRNRPAGLEKATCFVLNCDPDGLEPGSKIIYDEYLLKRTSDLLPETMLLPEDISILVQETYKSDVENQPYEKEYEKYILDIKNSETNASANCIKKAKKSKSTFSNFHPDLHAVLENMKITDDATAKATVREGSTSIDVIVLKRNDARSAKIITGSNTGTVIYTDEVPAAEESEEILKQQMRLPSTFSQDWCVNDTIRELEEKTNTYVPEWKHSPYLKGELIILLDENNDTTLCGKNLHYSKELGLEIVNMA